MERELIRDEVKETALQSPWVWALFIFMGAVFAANGTLVYFAYKTKPDLVVSDYYERGMNYESRTKLQNRMKGDLGWRIQGASEIAAVAGKPAPVTVLITDKDGRPAEPERVKLYAYRSSDARFDFAVPMAKAGDGRFSAQTTFPLKGVWDLIIEAEKGDERMNIAQRVTVLP